MKNSKREHLHQEPGALLQNKWIQPMGVTVVNPLKAKLHHQQRKVGQGDVRLWNQWFTRMENALLCLRPRAPSHH